MLVLPIMILAVCLLWLLYEMNFFILLIAFVGFIFGHSQSAYYFFLEKQIVKRLGKGFIFKELEFNGYGFKAIVQFKGIRYQIYTEARTLLSFEEI